MLVVHGSVMRLEPAVTPGACPKLKWCPTFMAGSLALPAFSHCLKPADDGF